MYWWTYAKRANLRQVTSIALLPTWGQLPPGTVLTGKGLTGPAFAGAIAFGSPRAATQVLAATRSANEGEPAACLTFKPIGAGGAIFAPMRQFML